MIEQMRETHGHFHLQLREVIFARILHETDRETVMLKPVEDQRKVFVTSPEERQKSVQIKCHIELYVRNGTGRGKW